MGIEIVCIKLFLIEISDGDNEHEGDDSPDSSEEEMTDSSEEEMTGESEYQERESTPSTESSQETIMIKPQKTAKDYLVSTNANDVIDLANINNKWTLKGGYNLSTSFLKRRNELVNKCTDCSTLLEPDEELSVNGIMLLDDDVDSNMIRFDYYEEACAEVKETYLRYKTEEVKSHAEGMFQFTKAFEGSTPLKGCNAVS
ncbi:hypothetical protein BDF20DRAFT_567759 [Mycotypha africana]|uniref:uncharacterized protein n=1 Tax=Mycotypha africana TaxID=64632 RepID=UPI002300268A|nr:uncharacterized protein BDF20DRAFT_567759 [Mycotypha africana]KAI8977438.1 hypothetical protein BDF20DRAFT_567759 [Mycotypha africana]